MSYEIGTATSTFDLMDKLSAFMASVSGWTLWSSINAYDRVYRSSGSTGVNDIFIRQRIGPVEHFLRGSDQYDYGHGTGDTGFLNFQSYVSFPQDGDAYDGASEIGQFGPRRFFITEDHNMYHQDMLSDQPGGAPHIKTGTPDGQETVNAFTRDPNCMERRRWTAQQGGPSGGSSFYDHNKPLATDSHRYFYFADIAGSNGVRRYSLRRTGGHINDDGTIDRNYVMPDVGFQPYYIAYVEDRQTRRPWLYVSGSSRTQWAKINLLNNSVSSVPQPVWPDQGTGGGGTFSQNAESIMTWDGEDNIFFIRGGSGFNQDKNGDWGRLNIRTGIWRTTSIPDDPEFRAIPISLKDLPEWGTTGHKSYELAGRHSFGFLSKKLSGFKYDRIYVAAQGSDGSSYPKCLLHMDLDDDGNPAEDSSFWVNDGQITSSGYVINGEIKFNRFGRMFHCSSNTSGRANGIYQISPQIPDRPMYYCDIKESGGIRWQGTSHCYFPQYSGGDGTSEEFIDGYACRVRTSIGSDTEYIFIADEDRVIVATKSNALLDPNLSDNISEWSVAYMGAIDSRYGSTPCAEFAESVEAGYSRKVRLTNVSGTFEEGGAYFVIDTAGGSYNMYNHIWNKSYTIAPSESVTILKIEGDVATISLRHDYAAGTKIALDPQPVGLFMWELEKFQMTNVLNRLYDDFCGSDDPSAQVYTCSIPEGEVSTSATGAVGSGSALPVWEYIVSTSEYEGAYSGREVRGKLKGMYALGKATGIDAGQIVAIGDDAYYVIEPTDYNKFVLIGPLG